jgi:hypothetical protein
MGLPCGEKRKPSEFFSNENCRSLVTFDDSLVNPGVLAGNLLERVGVTVADELIMLRS